MAAKRKRLEDTAGAKALRSWLATGVEGRSQTELARLLAISQPSVSQWLRGTSRPEHHHRIALERIAGIPVTDWLTRKERRVAFPASSAA